MANVYRQSSVAVTQGRRRYVMIDEVHVENNLVVGKDQYGQTFQITFGPFHDGGIVTIPKQGETWVIEQYKQEWRLKHKNEDLSQHDGLAPGHKLITADTLWVKTGTNTFMISGDTQIDDGFLTIADPVNLQHAATKAYVDAHGGAVASVFGRTGIVVAASGDYTVSQITGAAPLNSPAFTGTPTAPTPPTVDNSTKVATTAWVNSQGFGTGSVASVFGRTGAVMATSGDYTVAQITGAAPLASPTFTGTPAAPTPGTGDNSTTVATTAFVKNQNYVTATTAPVTSVFARTGAIISAAGDYTAAQVTNAADTSSSTTQTFIANLAAPTINAGSVINWVANSSFETNTTGWSGNAGGETLTRDTSTFQVGTASLKVHCDGVNTGQGTVQTTSLGPTAASGQTWTASVGFKGTNGASYLVIINGRNSSNSGVESSTTTFTATGAWQRVSVTRLLTNVGTTHVNMTVRRNGGLGSADDFWIDAAQIELGGTANTYTEGPYGFGFSELPTVGRFAGATTSGAPTLPTTPNGGYFIGDFVVDQTGQIWVCTVAGSPGTWVAVGSRNNQVASVFGRTGAVVATSGDYGVAQVTGAAPLASPTFTGTPAGPTPATADNSTTLATTAFVKAQAAGLQGLDGLDGATGSIGPQGIPGLDGLDGKTGATGPQGTQGLQGLDGLEGPTGPTGGTGPQGLQGFQGNDGLDGSTGPLGPQGIQGLQGVDGLDGLIGPTGNTGAIGPQGLDGLDIPSSPFSVGLKPPTQQVFTTGSGTYNLPAGCTDIFVELVAGGGGGGGTPTTTTTATSGGGGGGGGYAAIRIQNPAASYSYSVGAGGTGVSGAGGNGGGNTTFGSTLAQANGGLGGSAGVAITPPGFGGSGGAGGTATIGDILIPGAPGIYGFGFTTGSIVSGAGGQAGGIGGGGAAATGGSGNGINASAGGGGGSGADAGTSQATHAGGSGGNGFIVVTEFYGTAISTTQTFPTQVTAPAFVASGLAGTTDASRYAGGIASGIPVTGTFGVGDYIVDQTGNFWICTVAGSPGTWVRSDNSSLAIPVLRGEFGGTWLAAAGAGSFFCNMDSTPKSQPTVVNQVLSLMVPDADDVAPTGYKTQFKIKVMYTTNSTSPAVTATWALWELTGIGGTAGGYTESGAGAFSTVSTGSVVINAAALTQASGAWTDNPLTANHVYGYGVNLNQNVATNSALRWRGQVYRRFVPA